MVPLRMTKAPSALTVSPNFRWQGGERDMNQDGSHAPSSPLGLVGQPYYV